MISRFENVNWKTLERPPYCLDLSPCAYLSGLLKEALERDQFENDNSGGEIREQLAAYSTNSIL